MRSWIYFDAKYLGTELKTMFTTKYWREDTIAGLTVACVAIPLSLAVAMASGVAPGVGLISAIIGGIIAAIFGGTAMAVTGPTVTMAIVVANSVELYGMTGLLVIGVMCGMLQLICGLFRLGRFAKLIPLAVISAFTAGIGFIILIGQLPKALQLPTPPQSDVIYVIKHIGTYISKMNPMAFVFAIMTLVILKVLPRYFPRLPTPLIAVAIPTVLVFYFGLDHIQLVGQLPHSLNLPRFPNFQDITNWKDLTISALEVFGLASLETLLSSSAVDSMGKGDMHNPNQELIGQGLANVGVSLFGGIPVTGVIARSSVNLAAGAKTRRSAIIHSVVILAVIYLCPRLMEIIPVAALSGVLLSAALSMMNFREIKTFWKTDKTEVLVYIVTFFAIVLTDLISGVETGIVVAFLIVAIRMLATRADIKLWTNKEVLRVSLSGSMTFWSFEKLSKIEERVIANTNLKFVIFELNDVQGMDNTGASHLLSLARSIGAYGIEVIFHGLKSEQRRLLITDDVEVKPYIETITENDVKKVLERAGVKHSAADHLKHGMEKFLDQYVAENKVLIKNLAKDQKPHTLLITCSDSRLNPNSFLSVGLGELFIVRNVGNVIPKFTTDNYTYSEGAAIEFALGGLGVRNIIVCAHTECGAVKACVEKHDIKPGGLNNWLQLIKDGFIKHPPVDVYQGVKFNLLNQVENLKTYPIVAELLKSRELTISAWVYDIRTAHILEYNNTLHKFECTVVH